MNTAYSTTGLRNLYLGSNEIIQCQPILGGIPWNLTGGAATLILADPNGNLTVVPATINPGGDAYAPWTVAGAVGQWTRCWKLTDPTGFVQFSAPKAFGVASPY